MTTRTKIHHQQQSNIGLANAGLFYVRSKTRVAAHNIPESFRKLSLRTAVYGGDHLGAAFLCEQAQLSER
ncbi:hypothetical protein [Cronobacter sakazakii]|uniref:hypothetical protein n=2 Tax=Cronobacter sakazakii TaxID=28141 RepID=UPI0013FE1136|nr:hypothetical protein [Cronobacter sakazakii]EIZ8957626.1 hypothetical protein [Cronobacter sakazakii]EIZ8958218.1 hypothetical protein [Cronobacter sakazakii]ELY3576696.1 hypothetical protein [Cronobacter sakazakii]MBF4896800.1 hypothetical protein [Cronobacter sakazakii]MBF4949818.1 hypothetical protein [Cronobacter sakazakii]